jgi:DNA polymerase-3 subunit delta
MIIFLYGQNDYTAKQYLNRQKSMFLEKVGSDSLKVIAGQTASLSEIGLVLNTGSLFSQKRMVIIENIFTNKKAGLITDLHNYLVEKKIDKSPDIIIFSEEKTDFKGVEKKIFDYLKNQEHSKEFPKLTPLQISSWVKKEFSDHKVKINNQALQELLFRCDNDQWQLHQEINKLVNCGSDINLKQIQELTTPKYNDNIFALSDALSLKNKQKVTEIFQELLSADVEISYISNMIYKHLKNLVMIKALLTNGSNESEIVSQTKIHPYVVKKSLIAAKNFSQEKLIEFMNGLLKIEYNTRQGQGDSEKDIAILLTNI